MEIDQVISSYQPDDIGLQTVHASKIVFLAGIISAGKDTIKNKLLNSSEYHPIVTHTTRAPRINDGVLEQDGTAYHFVSCDQMCQLLLDHKMIEANHFGETYYGTSVEEFSDANKQNKIALTTIDINGISSFYNIAPHNVTAIFIIPPDYSTWLQRVQKRYASIDLFEKEWQARRDLSIAELEYALKVPYYHFVINDDLDHAVKVADKIAHSEDDVFCRGDDEARLRTRDFLDAIRQAI